MLYKIKSQIFAFWLRRKGVLVGSDCVFHGMPLVMLAETASVRIGSDCILASTSASTALGVMQPVIIKTLLPQSSVVLGKRVGISGSTIACCDSVIIGDDCLIGSGCLICDSDFHPVAPSGRREKSLADASRSAVKLGSNVFVGARSIILKGVEIGENSVIGAGSVVVKSIPAGVIAAGNPARVIRPICA